MKKCKYCNKEITLESKTRIRLFCSEECRKSICFRCKKPSFPLKLMCAECKKEDSRKRYLKKTESPKCLGCKIDIKRKSTRALYGMYCSDICKFNTKTTKEENGCWNWNPGLDGRGHTLVYFQKTNKLKLSPKKFSLEYFKNRFLINPIHIKNSCENKICVNPDHLYSLTDKIKHYKEDICRTCEVSFNESNIIVDNSKENGKLPYCKACYHNRSKRRICNYCKIELKGTGKKLYCSLNCLLKYNYSVVENGCWNWSGYIDKSNNRTSLYEMWGNKKINPRKIIYEDFYKKEVNLSGYGLVTSCGNKLCVNPEHSYLRQVNPCTIPTEDINKIKQFYFENNWSLKDLSKEFNKSETALLNIINNKTKTNSDNYLKNTTNICFNCQQQHDNTESEYCSPLCMQEFLLK